VIAAAGGGGGIIIGTSPLFSGAEQYPAGAVTTIGSGVPMLLSGITFEPAGLPGGLPRRDPDAG